MNRPRPIDILTLASVFSLVVVEAYSCGVVNRKLDRILEVCATPLPTPAPVVPNESIQRPSVRHPWKTPGTYSYRSLPTNNAMAYDEGFMLGVHLSGALREGEPGITSEEIVRRMREQWEAR